MSSHSARKLLVSWPLLLDLPHYPQPHPLPLLPDVESLRLCTHTTEDCVRIHIGFQEITHDTPDILMRVTAPTRGLIKELCEFIDQGIIDRLVC